MKEEKKYRYKLWLEVERVEIDEAGNEIGKHERGELWGIEPEKIYQKDNFLTGLKTRFQSILNEFQSIKR